MPKIKNGLFIFHRDFRIFDNTGLLEASKQCDNLYTCFIFTPEQVGKSNHYRSQNAIQFMIESLEDLSDKIHIRNGQLIVLYGEQNTLLKEMVRELDIEGIFFNKDYTPYAVKRDSEAKALCEQMEIECQMFSDYYLYEPGTITTGGGGAYKKYTPFYMNVVHKNPRTPSLKRVTNFKKPTGQVKHCITLKDAMKKFTTINPDILVNGGRTNGVARLKYACLHQKDYDEERDFFVTSTTFLSAYLKFGCVSIREVYSAFKRIYGLNHGLIRELLWREFFAHVLYSYPEVLGQSYQPRYRNIHWSTSKINFEKWTNGQTGFPIVDACMRQLNTSGYMHNRGRMTVASFLVKVLLIDWRLGEQYFAQQLTDYDIASNNGGWQGISGTGVDMKPYYRDMNPWIQSAKFDKEAEFIKHWVPELKEVEPRDIHNWETAYEKYKDVKYPKPMVNYQQQKAKMIELYK